MSVVIHCGMPSEKRILSAAFPNTLILSGDDKFHLASLVPQSCTRIVSMGLCGGLAPDLKVPDIAIATTVIDKSGDVSMPDMIWANKAARVLAGAGIRYGLVPYYSSGLFDEADETDQRAELYAKTRAHAIDDETRFTAAFAADRVISFNVVRPLSDAWDDNLPLMARGQIMNEDGSPNLIYLASVLGEDQGEDSESVFTVAEHYRQSLEALEATAKALANLINSD